MTVRGVIAEINRQSKAAARERERAARQANKERQAVIRRAEQARKAEERAAKQLARAAETERKRLEKEAKDSHIAAMQADVEQRNHFVSEINSDIDSLLSATLDVDDYVDLESLKYQAEHPPFDRSDLETPVAPPDPIPKPHEPELLTPPQPTGLKSMFGKKKHAAAVLGAKERYEQAMVAWKASLEYREAKCKAADEQHTLAEAQRVRDLEEEQIRYSKECEEREATAAEHNESVGKLITDLGYGTVDAVQEYVSIVLSNSIYPNHFPITHNFSFDPETAELLLQVSVPPPDKLSNVKTYKYVKASDEITSTPLSQKACKDRYTRAVNQVALRSLHEVYEADRRGIIHTINLEVGTKTTHPATGRLEFLPFVCVGSDREAFLSFDLSSVVPEATLEHLGAAVSKNPFGLIPANPSGIRTS